MVPKSQDQSYRFCGLIKLTGTALYSWSITLQQLTRTESATRVLNPRRFGGH